MSRLVAPAGSRLERALRPVLAAGWICAVAVLALRAPGVAASLTGWVAFGWLAVAGVAVLGADFRVTARLDAGVQRAEVGAWFRAGATVGLAAAFTPVLASLRVAPVLVIPAAALMALAVVWVPTRLVQPGLPDLRPRNERTPESGREALERHARAARGVFERLCALDGVDAEAELVTASVIGGTRPAVWMAWRLACHHSGWSPPDPAQWVNGLSVAGRVEARLSNRITESVDPVAAYALVLLVVDGQGLGADSAARMLAARSHDPLILDGLALGTFGPTVDSAILTTSRVATPTLKRLAAGGAPGTQQRARELLARRGRLSGTLLEPGA